MSRQLSILIIEDNTDGRETLRELLELYGYLVQTAPDGRTGVTLALRACPDVVVSDVGLPIMDGFEVARLLRAAPQGRGMLLIAMTGYHLPTYRQRAQAAGFDAFLVKPIRFRKLLDLISAKAELSDKAANQPNPVLSETR